MDAASNTEQVTYSNCTIVRDQDGKLNFYVGAEKVLGVANITMQPLNDGKALWPINLLGDRVRVAERVPLAPVYEYKDNVVEFKHGKLVAQTLPQESA